MTYSRRSQCPYFDRMSLDPLGLHLSLRCRTHTTSSVGKCPISSVPLDTHSFFSHTSPVSARHTSLPRDRRVSSTVLTLHPWTVLSPLLARPLWVSVVTDTDTSSFVSLRYLDSCLSRSSPFSGRDLCPSRSRCSLGPSEVDGGVTHFRPRGHFRGVTGRSLSSLLPSLLVHCQVLPLSRSLRVFRVCDTVV